MNQREPLQKLRSNFQPARSRNPVEEQLPKDFHRNLELKSLLVQRLSDVVAHKIAFLNLPSDELSDAQTNLLDFLHRADLELHRAPDLKNTVSLIHMRLPIL